MTQAARQEQSIPRDFFMNIFCRLLQKLYIVYTYR